MKRGLIILAVLAVVAAALTVAATVSSRASYTTSSQSTITTRADTTADWIRVYSSSTDPIAGDRAGYAHQHNVSTDPFIATEQDAALQLEWGSYPDANATFAFSRVLTFTTPATFPDPSVTQVTVTVTLAPDAGGTQMLRNPYVHLINQTGRQSSVTMGPNEKAQLDISLRTKKNPWQPGDTFRPHVILTVTYTGGPADYYVYDYTTLLYII